MICLLLSVFTSLKSLHTFGSRLSTTPSSSSSTSSTSSSATSTVQHHHPSHSHQKTNRCSSPNFWLSRDADELPSFSATSKSSSSTSASPRPFLTSSTTTTTSSLVHNHPSNGSMNSDSGSRKKRKVGRPKKQIETASTTETIVAKKPKAKPLITTNPFNGVIIIKLNLN